MNYYKTENGVRLKPSTRVFQRFDDAKAYAFEIRSYTGRCWEYDKDDEIVGRAYYVPR
jgi:hypothetical protein